MGASAHRSIGVAALLLSLLSPVLAPPASGEVYYTRDGSGAFHFSNVRRPDATVFLDGPWPAAAPSTGLATSLDEVPATAALSQAVARGAYDDVIARNAERYRLEPALVKAVIRAESAFRVRAVSPKGARGLMQLMPATARDLGCRNVYDPDQNIEAGAKHLRLLIDQFGFNLPRVLAAYNAGAGSVDRYRGIPPYAETQAYVAQVLRYRRDYLRRARLAKR